MLELGVRVNWKYQSFARALAAEDVVSEFGPVFSTSVVPLQLSVPTLNSSRPGPAVTVALASAVESKVV
jgi:hypothetical protein